MIAFNLRRPPVITTSRRVQETFPMRNYIFFDAGSTDLPGRYQKLSSSDADAFREEQLLRSDVATGGGNADQMRSRHQMEVYYNILNVIGDRMRRNPSAMMSLSGAANGDQAAGKTMADNVKNYLTRTFGIDASRIKTEGVKMPSNKSGSGNATGDDKKMVDNENYRVSIEGPNEILEPVRIISRAEELLDNDVVITIPTDSDIDSWRVIIEGDDSPRTFGPYRNTYTARINGKDLLGDRDVSRFQARVEITRRSGKVARSPQQEFRLVRADDEEQGMSNRYSILFEFDESKTVQTYQKFLTETVAPNIEDGSTVIIHGHTDVIGDPEYNIKLAQRRSEEAQTVLKKALDAAGKSVTFDTYGFGENEARAPFNNNLPEQRYYNRTVVIEVIPQI
jgi:outer membrane protein OmpA-like peptidoglycan-associated protein